MQGAEHQVAGERRLDRDLGGLEVADLADHDDVRVVRAGCARRACAKVRPIVGLTWIWLMPSSWYSTGSSTVRPCARGVLMSSSAVYSVVVLPEPVGPDDDDAALRRLEGLLEALEVVADQAQRGERGRQRRDLEDADGDVLAVHAGDGGEAQVDALSARELEARAAVLRQPPLGDVEVAHDLDAADDAGLQLLGELAQLVQHAVDAAAHAQRVLRRLQVDVRGVHAGGVGEQGVDDLDDVGVDDAAALIDLLALVAGVLELAARTEVDGHGLVEPVLRADERHHAPLGAHAHLVDGDDVERVGHGELEAAVVVEADGHEPAPHDEVARQQAERRRLRRGLREVDDADVHLAGDGGDDVVLGDEPLGDQEVAEPSAALVLACEGVVQLGLGDETAGDQQVAQA